MHYRNGPGYTNHPAAWGDPGRPNILSAWRHSHCSVQCQKSCMLHYTVAQLTIRAGFRQPKAPCRATRHVLRGYRCSAVWRTLRA
jgi:hypothetical protein